MVMVTLYTQEISVGGRDPSMLKYCHAFIIDMHLAVNRYEACTAYLGIYLGVGFSW